MEFICLEDAAFYTLVETVVARHCIEKEKWICDTKAMQLLKIKSETMMEKLRDEGKIRFSQPQKKIILYDCDSIETYLNSHALTLSNFETPEALVDYQKGFNEGYQIAKHMLKPAEQLSSLKSTSPHLTDLQDGCVQYQHEKKLYQCRTGSRDCRENDRLDEDKTINKDIETKRD